MKITILDNQDSFVYNLRDEFLNLGHDIKVFRNTVELETILEESPDLICLSPGPGHPREAGNMMELIADTLGKIPLLGVCLGYQALIEHYGGIVEPVGPVHGQAHEITLTAAGKNDPIFAGITQNLNVARYHSLGCTNLPKELNNLARIGKISMIARAKKAPALGFQFHPESILTAAGPQMLKAAIASLTTEK
ncbi:gamma-glutamyl-gamma-aminobutyrate hydrolase family protein [Actinomycetaceae bacterium TAE3-ERU4]|nr:gamma-glutamyl-gamma-aminobutyrate hydrolase family protein [Actinomycetaceae bacterium TAE3-ERU4]